VQYFANTAGAFWFLDIVSTEIYKLTSQHDFIAITLDVDNGKAKITATDGNDKRIFQKNISYTDCPNGSYSFWISGDVLMLPSEY
jgi:hypothetical protein